MIKALNLNRLTSLLVTQSTPREEVEAYLDSGIKSFCLRDSSSAMGNFQYDLSKEQVLKSLADYSCATISECMKDADVNLVLQGEIQITKDFEVMATLDDKKGISNREAMKAPTFPRLHFDLKECREPSIRGLTTVLDYIIEHELIDVIVEFTLFNEPVGLHRQPIIIWELRNY